MARACVVGRPVAASALRSPRRGFGGGAGVTYVDGGGGGGDFRRGDEGGPLGDVDGIGEDEADVAVDAAAGVAGRECST